MENKAVITEKIVRYDELRGVRIYSVLILIGGDKYEVRIESSHPDLFSTKEYSDENIIKRAIEQHENI